MDNQRTILLVALVLIGFLIWQQWRIDQAQQAAPQANAATAQTGQGTGTPATRADVPEAGPAAAVLPAAETATGTAKAAAAASRIVHVRTDVLDLRIDTRGGTLVRAELPTYPVSVDRPDEPYVLFNTDPATYYVAQNGFVSAEAGRAPTHHAVFRAEQTEYRLPEGADTLEVPLTWTGPDGVTVTRTYVLHRGQFVIDVRNEVHNGGQQPWAAQLYRQLVRVNTQHGRKLLPTYLGAAWYDGKYHKLKFKDMAEEPLKAVIQGGWVAMLEHYFVSAWIGDPERSEQVYSKIIGGSGEPRYLVGMREVRPLQVAPGADGRIDTRLYVGPKLQKHLAEVAPGLDLTTDYGMFTVFAKPLFWLLSFVHGFIGNWGWAIVIVTILLKLAFYRLSAASYRSMARMRAVQPKLQALKERYGDDKQRMNQELMALYKKEKINPLGGCLPMLVQIPVFIGFYWMLLETVELRQAPFILWIRDLSAMDPYFVLPILMGISMLVQQKLNPAPMDPIQQKVMMAMPIVFTVFFAFFPSGLVLYWLTNNLLSIAQQWWIMKQLGEQPKPA